MTGSDAIEAVFSAALERPEAERAAFIEAACAGDAQARRRVERLLRAHVRGTGFLESPAAARVGDSLEAGRRLGAWELVEPLGEGGMGAVWLARRADSEFEKLAAVKVIKRGMDTDGLLRRFAMEKRVLARLEHANIARLLDAGALDDGRPYLVMERVEGERIDAWCDARGLGIRERVALFAQVCAAVKHAHGLLIVHRDIKPGNILVTDEGVPKLLDFGIAKVLDSGADPEVTGAGGRGRLLTPRYASPEQLRGEPVTTAADVYGLGSVLYELLTGSAAHGDTRSTLEGALRTVEQTAARPSAMLTDESARARGGSRARVSRWLRGDLDTIVLKAVHPEAARRYAGAGELLDDLVRYLEGRPVLAQRDSAWYRARKFVGRYPLTVGLGAAAVLALALGLVASLWMYAAAERARIRAERSAYVSDLVAAESAIRGGDFGTAVSRLEAAPAVLRGWEWAHLKGRTDRRLAQMDGHAGMVMCGAFAPGGAVAATGGTDGRVLLWDGRSGASLGELPRHAGEVYGLAFSGDGDRIATACADKVVRVWRDGGAGVGWRPERELPAHTSRAVGVAFRPGGGLVSMDMRGQVRLWEIGGAGGFAEIGTGIGHTFAMALSPDGRWLAVGSHDGAAVVVDMDRRAVAGRLTGHTGSINALAFGPDGGVLASSSQDRTGRLWDFDAETGAGRVRAVLGAHTARVDGLAFSPDGREVYSVSWDRTVRAWDAATGRPVRIVGGSPGQLRVAAIGLEGTRLLTAGDAGVHLWDPVREDVPSMYTGMANVDVAVSRDGRRAVSSMVPVAGAGERRAVWDVRERRVEGEITFAPADEATSASALSDDGRWWIRGTRTGAVEAHPVDGGAARAVGRLEGRVAAIAVAGGSIVAVGESGEVACWRDGVEAARGSLGEFKPRCAALSGDGAVLVVGCEAGDVALVDARRAVLRAVLRPVGPLPGGGESRVRGVAVSEDGTLACAVGDDRLVHVLRTSDGAAVARLEGHAEAVLGASFSADGSRLATAGADRTVRIWGAGRDGERYTELVALHGHGFSVWRAWFAPGGGTGEVVISASGDNTIRVWE